MSKSEPFYADRRQPSDQRFKVSRTDKSRDGLRLAGNRSQKGLPMFTADQYRAKAIEYSNLTRSANGPNEVCEYQRLERSFTELADNAQWITDNPDKTIPAAQNAARQ